MVTACCGPKFYFSEGLDAGWLMDVLRASARQNMGFVVPDSLSVSFLPTVQALAYQFGLRPPLWRHASRLRCILKLLGKDVQMPDSRGSDGCVR